MFKVINQNVISLLFSALLVAILFSLFVFHQVLFPLLLFFFCFSLNVIIVSTFFRILCLSFPSSLSRFLSFHLFTSLSFSLSLYIFIIFSLSENYFYFFILLIFDSLCLFKKQQLYIRLINYKSH